MGKFSRIDEGILSIFAEEAWIDEDIPVYPENFSASKNDKTFVRLQIIASDAGVNIRSAGGVLIAEIFVPRERSATPISIIADALDMFLVGRMRATTDGGVVQFFGSSIGNKQSDKDNPSLYKADYSINFNYNEVM